MPSRSCSPSTGNCRAAVRIILIAVLAAFLCPALPASASPRPTQAEVTLLRNREYVEALLKGIRGSRKSVILVSYLFKVGEKRGNQPAAILEELVQARRRGVDVTVIMEKSGRRNDSLDRDNLHTAAILARNGIKVFFDAPGTVTHLKTVVIDNRFVYMGSHNLSQMALTRNNELSMLLDSPELAAEIADYLNRL